MRLRSILLTSIACAIALPAAAADLSHAPITKAPIAAPLAAYNWSGFYLGGHAGGVWGDKDWTDVTVPAAPFNLRSGDMSGFLAGGQVGVNWQVNNIVFGIEGQVSWTNADANHTCVIGFATCHAEANYLGSIAGRMGLAFDRTLIYVKGGGAFINEDFLVRDLARTVVGTFDDETRWGWMVGGGIEWGITGNWSAKIEYNFMDFREDTFRFVTPVPGLFRDIKIDQQMHVVKAGINYRFNWGGLGPSAGRY